MSDDVLPRVLLTGFEPFDGEPVNPSWDTVRTLHGATIGGHLVVARRLPTAFAGATEALQAALDEHTPTAVIAVGQAGGRAQISLERVAINLIDARIPDNEGAQPIDEPVVAEGPAAYFSTLPLKAMLSALHRAGIPAEISHTAGTFVCNQVFYALCHALRNAPQVPAGFVHVPFLAEQATRHPGKPSISSAVLTEALQVMVRAVLDPPPVTPGMSAGREH